MRIYDVSVPISSRTPIYDGDPGVDIQAWTSLAKGDSANVSFLHFGAHTGTHVDAPAHFIQGGRRIDQLAFDALIGSARVIRVADEKTEIDIDFIRALDLDGVERVLFHTRNSGLWNDNTFHKDFVYLSSETAQYLIDLGIKL